MIKNLIPVIAKELGVEIGEEFEIKGMNNTKYRFGNDMLESSKKNQTSGSTVWICSALYLNRLAEIEIIRLPFNPKEGDYYWTYWCKDFSVIRDYWGNTPTDYALKLAGIVFRTQEEAIAARPAKYLELTGKEWQDCTKKNG